MRIVSGYAENFGSYKNVDFDFQHQGLTLIQGATGSGKSTLCDLTPWVLFGVTAKNGPVSDIISWPGDKVTTGVVVVDLQKHQANQLQVTRVRGSKPKDNDLYFCFVGFGGDKVRGKDINDTQKLINQTLNVDADLYLAAAYYHEFSATAQFFTTTAKNRRLMCEQLVDLSLATKLQKNLTNQTKVASQLLDAQDKKITSLQAKIQTLSQVEETEKQRAESWERDRNANIKKTLSNKQNFENNRKRTIHKKCRECGTELACPKEVVDTSVNPYAEALSRLEDAINPHTSGVKDHSEEIARLKSKLETEELSFNQIETQVDDYILLQDVAQHYRSVSISNTIKYLEEQANKLLNDNFDAEIRVSFEVEAADKLEVSVFKDGNLASFTQLSKGQRQLLKLCFAVSVMQAIQNHHGITLSQVFLDEATDGLDESMKVKTFKLLETLTQYESVFLVEHSEALKSKFLNSYHVELVNGESQIQKV